MDSTRRIEHKVGAMSVPSSPGAVALRDILDGLRKYELAFVMAWQEIRIRYRRSMNGPFWLTISSSVMIGTLGIVFGTIFKSNVGEFLPFLASGIITWQFVVACVTDGCATFISSERIIKQLKIPLFTHVMCTICRNLIILAHNIVILPVVLLCVGRAPCWTLLLEVVTLPLLVLNLTWAAVLLATICARYRDFPQVVSSIMQVLFYLTPIIWMPSLIPGRLGAALINLNPVYHLIELVRAPILGQCPSLLTFAVALGLACVGWTAAVAVFGRYKKRVPYWL